jgi:hypothetical protein
MSCEHGCGDGLSWVRALSEVYNDVHALPSPFSKLDTKQVCEPIAPARELDFIVNSPQSQKHMQKAADFAKAQTDDLDLDQQEFSEYGAEAFKRWKVAPDATMQMAFQLAYSRVKPLADTPAVYEACAMKHFFHGRTETIRSCTSESKNLVQVFNDKHASAESKRAALVQATMKHSDVSKGARSASGPNIGVDRHLTGLRTAAADLGLDVPEVFADPNFSKGNTWNISTSNVTTNFIEAFAFGAVVNSGFGIGYMTTSKYLPLTVSSWKSGQKSEKESSKAMGEAVLAAVKDFEGVQSKP